jgi:hypothetical protein
VKMDNNLVGIAAAATAGAAGRGLVSDGRRPHIGGRMPSCCTAAAWRAVCARRVYLLRSGAAWYGPQEWSGTRPHVSFAYPSRGFDAACVHVNVRGTPELVDTSISVDIFPTNVTFSCI